jgi:TorA maturation chaperone TorD
MSAITLDAADEAAIDLARECLYRFFAAALSDPRGPAWAVLADPDERVLAGAAADLLRAEAEADPVPLGAGERPAADLDLFELLAALRRPREELAVEHDRVFGLVTVDACPPYETEYCPTKEPFYRAQQLADAAGFYRAFGLTGAQAAPDRPDHVARELEFLAHLLFLQRLADDGSPTAGEQAGVCGDAARRFFRDHVAWWVPSFAAGLHRRAGTGVYAALGRALAAFVPAERGRLNVSAPQAPVRVAPVERPEDDEAGCAGCAARA